MISKEQVESFNKNGFLILKSFYDLELDIHPIQHGIYTLIGILINKYKLPITRPDFSSQNFDAGYQDLIRANRKYGAELYDAIKQLPSFIRLVGNPKHEELSEQLLATQLTGVAAAGYGIRIDNPYEERFRAQWHQEYLSQLRSRKGLVFWSPLIHLTPEHGPVELCPGSHREGVIPVSSHDPDNPEKTGAYGVRLQNENEILGRYECLAPLTEPGDLVILDWLLIHRSGENRSDRSRWTMQMRYFDFLDSTGIALSWCGSFNSGVDVAQVLPEYFQNKG